MKKETAGSNKKLGMLLRPSYALFFVILFGFAVAAVLLQQYLLAIIEFSAVALFLILYLVFRSWRRREIHKNMQKSLDKLTSDSGSVAPFPMVTIRLEDNGIVFANDAFINITGLHDHMGERKLETVISNFNSDWLFNGRTQYPDDVQFQNRRYRIYGTTVTADDPKQTRLGVLYLSDLTELYQIKDEYIRSRPVVSLILIDNYEELTKNLTEGAISALHARINDAITKWTEPYGALLRRLERNRYILVFEKRDLKHAVEDKFSLLEDIHEITNPSGLPASISIGLGVDAESFAEGYDFAAVAIEMALSRGGDQAVVKDRVNFHFYGGRNKEADHRNKVRSRITAGSLM